jgi:hypothetical protein
MTKDRCPLMSMALALAVGFIACGSPVAPAEDVPVTRVLRGSFSALNTSERLVIRSHAQLEEVWASMFRTQSHPPALPVIDFTNDFAIVAAAGARPTSGFCVSVESAAAADGVLTVTVTTTSPPGGSGVLQVVTTPFDVVRLPRRPDSVRFVEKTQTAPCG